MHTKRFFTTLSLASVALIAASCLSADSTGTDPATVEETTFAPALGVDLAASTRTTNGAYVRDITVGTGAVLSTGQVANMKYSGYLSNGTLFDTDTTNATVLTFTVGARQVIGGFDEAAPGMRVGGTRQMLIPPSLGYGPYDQGPIPGNSVLVFNVKLVSIQ